MQGIRDGLLARVIVEPPSCLTSKIACIDHPAERVGGGEAVFAVRLGHHIRDRDQRVQPDEVRERERPHWVAGSGHHPGVDVLDRPNALLVCANRVEHVWDEQPVDDEAAVVRGGDGGLAELLAQVEAELDGVVARPFGADHLEQGHHLGGVEEVQTDEPLRALGRGGLVGDGQGRRIGREVGVVPDHAIERFPHLKLAVQVLGDRLDDQVAVGQVAVLKRRRDPGQHRVGVSLLELALLDGAPQLLSDLADALVQLALVDLADDDLPAVLSADLGDSMAHQATADDTDLLDLHSGKLLVGSDGGAA